MFGSSFWLASNAAQASAIWPFASRSLPWRNSVSAWAPDDWAWAGADSASAASTPDRQTVVRYVMSNGLDGLASIGDAVPVGIVGAGGGAGEWPRRGCRPRSAARGAARAGGRHAPARAPPRSACEIRHAGA